MESLLAHLVFLTCVLDIHSDYQACVSCFPSCALFDF